MNALVLFLTVVVVASMSPRRGPLPARVLLPLCLLTAVAFMTYRVA